MTYGVYLGVKAIEIYDFADGNPSTEKSSFCCKEEVTDWGWVFLNRKLGKHYCISTMVPIIYYIPFFHWAYSDITSTHRF